jgi:SAM-dependent methyltransferase
MKLLQTHHLSDGKGFNQGQPAYLIEIENGSDFDALLANIVRTGYYDSDYFTSHSGYEPGRLVTHFFFVAEMVLQLRPRQLLEVGCGRGDVLSLLQRRGVSIQGIDFSQAARAQAWPNVRDDIELGDFTDICACYAATDRRFDVLCGFDIWEHLHPGRLNASIRAVVNASTEDALFFFVVPAFGKDRIFGEAFPLEFEENRSEFQMRVPFRHLKAERTDPPIPSSGHLIWAHTDWWERQFQSHGLARQPALEQRLHIFDRFLPHSVRSFYIFARTTKAAARRAAALEAEKLGPIELAAIFARFLAAAYVKRELKSGIVIELLRNRIPPPVRSQLKRLLRRA